MYQSLIQLSWIDKLLDNVKTLFTSLYSDQLKKPLTSIVNCDGFDEYFNRQVEELEKTAGGLSEHAAPEQRAPAQEKPHEDDTELLAPPPPLTRKGVFLEIHFLLGISSI